MGKVVRRIEVKNEDSFANAESLPCPKPFSSQQSQREAVNRISILSLLLGILLVDASNAQEASHWSQFRGVTQNALAVDASIPTELGPGVNQCWKTVCPPGNSSPVVWADNVFVTSSDENDVSIHCFSVETGAEKWSRTYPLNFQEEYVHVDCSPAAPTCCTNGRLLFSYFGAVGLLAHNLDGGLVWKKEFAPEPAAFGTTKSPILYDDSLFLVRDVRGLSAVFCLDPATGDERWMTPRPERSTSYSTPTVWETSERTELVIAGSGVLESYDVKTGEHLWEISNLPAIVCPSPTASDDLLVYGAWTTAHVEGDEKTKSTFDEDLGLSEEEATDMDALFAKFDKNKDDRIEKNELPESRSRDAFRFVDRDKDQAWSKEELDAALNSPPAPGRNVMIAVKPGGNGDITKTHVVWSSTKKLPYVASPLIANDRVYYAKNGGFLTCLELSTGDLIYQKRLGLGGEYYACPIMVGDRILIAAERGKLFTIKAGDDYEMLSEADFSEPLVATPAITNNRLIVRTGGHLYAFGS